MSRRRREKAGLGAARSRPELPPWASRGRASASLQPPGGRAQRSGLGGAELASCRSVRRVRARAGEATRPRHPTCCSRHCPPRSLPPAITASRSSETLPAAGTGQLPRLPADCELAEDRSSPGLGSEQVSVTHVPRWLFRDGSPQTQ